MDQKFVAVKLIARSSGAHLDDGGTVEADFFQITEVAAVFGVDQVHHAGFAAVGHLKSEFAVRGGGKFISSAAADQFGRGVKKISDTIVHQFTHQSQTAEVRFRVHIPEVAETGSGRIGEPDPCGKGSIHFSQIEMIDSAFAVKGGTVVKAPVVLIVDELAVTVETDGGNKVTDQPFRDSFFVRSDLAVDPQTAAVRHL